MRFRDLPQASPPLIGSSGHLSSHRDDRAFAAILEDRAQAAAWKLLPSWAVVATADEAIPPDAERQMAVQAGAQPIEVDASHSIALSQPKAVADLIRTAATDVTTKTTTA